MAVVREDLDIIFTALASARAGYGYLKWNEVAMVKADMMNVRHRWLDVDVEDFRRRCQQAGMDLGETAELVDYLRRAQAGRRLVPQGHYRSFRFRPDPPEPEPSTLNASREW